MTQFLTRPRRDDFAFPFAIDAHSGRCAQADYEAHVDQMIRQILLTDPGERVNLPRFGCGLRSRVFQPLAPGMDAAIEILIRGALTEYLAGVIEIVDVQVVAADPNDGPYGEATLTVTIAYVLLDTLAAASTQVRLP